jgi:hypothetical protein
MIIKYHKNYRINYPLDRFSAYGIFKLAKTTRPVSF